MIRKPIITVLGHVDAGKTKMLDAVRGTVIAEKEAGGITQHIGATEVPIETVKKISGGLIQKYKFNITIPGLLFIDTPGHEAFTNLRKRGGSIADLAILVVDIQKGLQNQTVEAIEILKTYKTPFIVAANKIDSIRGWQLHKGSISDSLKEQHKSVLEELDTKVYELVGQLHEKGFNSERFDRVKDLTKEVIIIPTSAKFGEGTPEVLLFLAGLSQKYLEKKLSIHVKGRGKGTVLDVKEERGLGKTIDVILYDGNLKVGDVIVVGGTNELIVTKIRALLQPKPLDEIRNPKEKFNNVMEVHAAAGVKISAPNLEKALAGSPLREMGENAEREVMEEIQRVKIDSEAIGPVLRADTLGSLEALTKLLEGKGIKVRKADVGDISRRDIMEAETIKERDQFKGVVFGFHVKMDEAAKEEALKKEVKVFSSDVVYRLLEDYNKWIEEEKRAQTKEKMEKIVFPAKIKILSGYVFRNSKPAIVGVRIIAGKLRTNIELSKKGRVVGKVKAIQLEGKDLKEATENQEVAISIEGATVGKNIEEGDELITFIPKKKLEQLEAVMEQLSEREVDLLEEIKGIQKVELREETA